MFFDPRQLAASILGLFVVAVVAAVTILHKSGNKKATRRWCFFLLAACAVLGMDAWTRFGEFHSIFEDADYSDTSPKRRKEEHHQPFHFHEFFHYYIASKYFKELGYESLYDCTTLADQEISQEENRPPRISGYVRNLSDVLTDKTYDEAIQDCRTQTRSRFTQERWDSFKSDLRELHHLVPDDWWGSVIYDAGFNPPPSWVILSSSIANIIPIRMGTARTYLVSTSLDVVLLIGIFVVLWRVFGKTTAVIVAFYFGASFIASYGWNGGAFLRYTWVASVVFGIAAVKRGRWELAGAMFAAATCDRLFPMGFAVGALIPLGYRAWKGRQKRDIDVLVRFAIGFGATSAIVILASIFAFGFSSWAVFFDRIVAHGDIYYGMHIGVKKVLTWRDWVPNQNFQAHNGLITFKNWNLRLRDTWRGMRAVVVLMQLGVLAAVFYGGIRRRPYESAILCGVCVMFFFNLPANYYYVIVVLVPGLVYRAAATAPSAERRLREYAVFMAFNLFWLFTLFASRLTNDLLIYDYYICLAFLFFLIVWMAAWLEGKPRMPFPALTTLVTLEPTVTPATTASSATSTASTD